MARLVIYGAGDIARLAHHYFSHDSPHDVAGFIVDHAFRKADTFLGLPLGDAEDAPRRYPASAGRHAERTLQLTPGSVTDVVKLVDVSEISSAEATRIFPAYFDAVERLVKYVDGWSAR
jgi:hypothetical protein